MKLLTILATMALCGLFVTVAGAEQLLLLDYVGYDYTDPAPHDFTTLGQEYVAVGDADNINPAAVATDPGNNEYTFVLHAGTLTYAETLTVGPFEIAEYQFNAEDGTYHIYEDPIVGGTARDYSDAPGSFEDGTLILGAKFMELTISVNLTLNTAQMNGTLDFYCGEEWGSLPCYFGWTFAGQTSIPDPPSGYMWAVDGLVYVEEDATRNTTWGDVKGLFR